MIYLDYSATTPVLPEILNSFNKVCTEYIGNPNSMHSLGIKSKELLNSATKQIAQVLNIKTNEIIYTSGSTESNNIALIGTAFAKKKQGNHIIVSKLEHESIYGICKYLEENGFIIKQIIKKENPDCIFHSDMTQALGKCPINLNDVDLASFSSHKIYAPKGVGMLYKSSNVNIKQLMYGSNGEFRPGTPNLPGIVTFSKAVRLATEDLNKKEDKIRKNNQKIVEHLKKYPKILINNTNNSIPNIVNISLMDIKPETFVHALEKHEVYVSSNTACASGKISNAVLGIYNDKVRALTTIRISLSHLTTNEEIEEFLNIFDEVYEKLEELRNV